MKNLILFITATLSVLQLMGSAADTTAAASQSLKAADVKKADNLFGKQNYATALELYNKAWQANPANANLNFKLGLCWHYLLQNPQLCQSLFSNAIQYTDSKYNFYSPKETKASDDALYYLGKTYLNLNSSDSAIICLAQYQNKLRDNLPLDAGRQLVMCLNYNQLINQPRQLKITALAGEINSTVSAMPTLCSLSTAKYFS
jgi:tetratricopeptide (TPR) repeat protein